MKLEVEVRTLVNGDDVLAGTVMLDGETVSYSPDTDLMRTVATEPVPPFGGGPMLSPDTDRVKWLHALQFQYRSSHLRAGAPKKT